MAMKVLSVVFLFALVPIASYGDETVVPFTLEDRERIIRLEERMTALDARVLSLEASVDEKISALNDKIDRGFENVNSRFSSIETLIYFVLGGMLALIGFILWDRRSTLKPFELKAKDLQQENERIKEILREWGRKDKELAKVLRTHGLM